MVRLTAFLRLKKVLLISSLPDPQRGVDLDTPAASHSDGQLSLRPGSLRTVPKMVFGTPENSLVGLLHHVVVYLFIYISI